MTEPPYVVDPPEPAGTPGVTGATGMTGVTGLRWVKSSRSQAQNNNCVELAVTGSGGSGGGVAVRDSKDRNGAVLTFSPRAWRAFVSSVRGL